MFKLGGFDLSHLPTIAGAEMPDFATLDVDVGGVVGADLLAFFRVTFADEGRFIWIEVDPTRIQPQQRPQPPMKPDPDVPPPPSPAPRGSASGAPPAAHAPSSSAPAAPTKPPPPGAKKP